MERVFGFVLDGLVFFAFGFFLLAAVVLATFFLFGRSHHGLWFGGRFIACAVESSCLG